MFAKIRKQQLQSYSFHSRDRPQPLMSRCGEIRKKNISKLWILVMMTKVGGGLPGGGDRILHGFEFLNIWMVRHEMSVCEIASWTVVIYQVSPSQRRRKCGKIVQKYCAHIPPTVTSFAKGNVN